MTVMKVMELRTTIFKRYYVPMIYEGQRGMEGLESMERCRLCEEIPSVPKKGNCVKGKKVEEGGQKEKSRGEGV